MVKSHELQQLIDEYLDMDTEAAIIVSDDKGNEIQLLSLGRGAQQTVLDSFNEWMRVRNKMSSIKSNSVIN